MLILTGREIQASLKHLESEILESVEKAYLAHRKGSSTLPFSSFLHLPNQPRSRIIALPAFLGEDFQLAGIKWISSFPGNLDRGLQRASAVMILNNTTTGFPEAMIEGSVVSAKRTAASAALAARALSTRTPTRLALIGCGLINFEIARFLSVALGGLPDLVLFDLSANRAHHLGRRIQEQLSHRGAWTVADRMEAALGGADLVSFATTAGVPHVGSLEATAPDAVLLHISLRDLTPETILGVDNVVDDAEHVLRERTSLHLTQQQVGHHDFVRCTLGDILAKASPARASTSGRVVFSPFGLGILDLAVAQLAIASANSQGLGSRIAEFSPAAEA